MVIIDTRPPLWREWEQLGHAVAAQAVLDYANARKRESGKRSGEDPGGDHYDPAKDMKYYRKFFYSGYFTRICPKYDGKELFDALESGGWKTVSKEYRAFQGIRRYNG